MVLSGLAAMVFLGGLVLLMGALTGFGRGRRRATAGSDGSAGWSSSGGSDCDSGSDGGCDGGGGSD